MKQFAIFSLFLFTFSIIQAQDALSGADKLKLMTADENYQKEYYQEAYRMYKEIKANSPNNAMINYKCGVTAIVLNYTTESLMHLQTAAELDSAVNKELNYWLGRAQHRNGLLEEALASFQKFKATLKGGQAKNHIVNEHIYQIEVAQKLLANPVNVTIKNMGPFVNSEYKESNPSITADGTMLIFATCRPENQGGQIDPDLGIYYQDVWYTETDSVTGLWTDSEPIYGNINTDLHDACTSISADGSVILLYRSVRGGDIYYSRKRKNGDFREPVALEGKTNSTYYETGACMSADKKILYFISERIGGGEGNGDIWMAKKTGSYEYGEASNLGEVVNTIDDENSVFLHPDGKTLYFSSNSMNSIGGYDIFKTELIDGEWTKPVNLGYPINTLGDEMHFVVSTDGTKAYFTSKREDSYGDLDIYEVDLTNYVVPNPDGTAEGSSTTYSGPPIGIIRGKLMDKSDTEPLEGKIKITDPETGKKINETEANEAGEYLITVEAGKSYTMTVEVDDYTTITETFEVPIRQTGGNTVVKVYLMEIE